MKTRSSQAMKKKVDVWIKEPVMQTGAGRLIIYLEKEYIRPEFLEGIPEDVLKDWDEQISFESIGSDMCAVIETVVQHMSQMNITVAFGYIPMLIADLYALNKPVTALEAKYKQIIRDYVKTTLEDTQTALLLVLGELTELLKDIVKRYKLDLRFNLDEALVEMINASNLINKDFNSNNDINSPTILEAIDQAIEEHEKETGEDLIKEITEEDLEEIVKA